MTAVLETSRLRLRQFTLDDAAFTLAQLNEPSWLRFIGDKNVHTLDDARRYLSEGPLAMYARHGFGLWLVELKPDHTPIGMCGLIRRESLDDVDIGFAFLPAYWSQGHAHEAASATLAHAREAFGLRRVVGITAPDNTASAALLRKLGLRFETMVEHPDGERLQLFAIDLMSPTSRPGGPVQP